MSRKAIGRRSLVLCLCLALLLGGVPASAKTKTSKKVNVKKVKVTSVMGSTKKAYVAQGKTVKLTKTVTVNPSKRLIRSSNGV